MNEARIKLAEARGYVRVKSTANHWYFPKGSAAEGSTIGLVGLPDPFTNANDDYAVLEWMRPKNFRESKPIMGPEHERWRDFIFELRLIQLKENRESSAIQEGYMLGDNARAACSVLAIALEAA